MMLAIETSGGSSLAVVFDPSGLPLGSAASPPASRSRDIFGLIDRAMAEAGVELAGLDGIAVCVGPGSFTGIRIGVVAAKVLCGFSGLALVPFTSLETALASAGKCTWPVVAAVDGKRGELFVSTFAAQPGVAPLEDGLEAIPRAALPAYLAGRLGAALAGEAVRAGWSPRPQDVALAACRAAASGRREEPELLSPIYVRRPDAVPAGGTS